MCFEEYEKKKYYININYNNNNNIKKKLYLKKKKFPKIFKFICMYAYKKKKKLYTLKCYNILLYMYMCIRRDVERCVCACVHRNLILYTHRFVTKRMFRWRTPGRACAYVCVQTRRPNRRITARHFHTTR